MVRLKLPYLLLFSSSLSFGHFMPENDLHLRRDFLSNEVTEEDFNRVLDSFQTVYGPILQKEFGKTLVINRRWTDNTVNASASQNGNVWSLNMYGGLARAAPTTLDGFALVVCHELGHHLAGYPFYFNQWAASEGQSDYFASLACAKFMWKNDAAENALARQKMSASEDFQIAQNACDRVYATKDEQNLCYRIALAGHSLAELLSAGGGVVPSFGTPDVSVKAKTDVFHPAAQCRLDTFLAGAICDRPWRDSLIPGKDIQDRQSLNAVIQAAPYACHDYQPEPAARPRCWFSPDDYTPLTLGFEKLALQGHLQRGETLDVPPITFQVGETAQVKISGDGDADLYTRWDQMPDFENYDCAPFLFGSQENCTLEAQGKNRTLFTMVEGWATSSQVSVSIGATITAKICRNFQGGLGEPFSCWENYTCRLVRADDQQNPLNWCISF